MTYGSRGRSRAEAWTWRLSLLAFGLVALLAHTTLDAPFPTIFVDPFGSFSEVELPSWGAPLSAEAHARPRFPDVLVAIDGLDIGGSAKQIPDVLAQVCADSLRAGRDQARLTFQTTDGRRYDVTRPIRTLGATEVGFFFWLYAGIGLLLLWAGLLISSMRSVRSGGSAYRLCTCGMFLFLLSFYDYHTTRILVPLFSLGTIVTSLGFLELAVGFPSYPAWWTHGFASRGLGRTMVRSMRFGLFGLGAAAWAYLTLGPAFGQDTTPVRLALTLAAPLGAVLLVLSMLARLLTASRAARRELMSAVIGMAIIPAVVAAGFIFPSTDGLRSVHLLMPFAVFLSPLSVGYALVRHNIFETERALQRRAMVITAVIGAILVALMAWLLLRGLVIGTGKLGGVIVAGLLGASIGLLGYRAALHRLFPAQASFRPMIVLLADKLARVRKLEDIRREIIQVVRAWMEADHVDIVHAADLRECTDDAILADLSEGRVSWYRTGSGKLHLLVPLLLHGESRGVLVLGPRWTGRLYEEQDLALLQTVASVAATALRYAEVLAETTELGRLDVGSTRDEKKMALSLLAAEMSHEIAYPLNFFRFLLGRARKGQMPSEEDIQIGCEEVGRLERMLGSLRRMHVSPPSLAPVDLRAVVSRATQLLRDQLGCHEIVVDLDDGVVLLADPDPLLQLVANLLRNALQATPGGGQVGLKTVCEAEHLVCEVWDSGPGVPASVLGALFSPWVTGREGGLGLGLAISHRIARSFGWTLTYARDEAQGRTAFRISIPSTHCRPPSGGRPV